MKRYNFKTEVNYKRKIFYKRERVKEIETINIEIENTDIYVKSEKKIYTTLRFSRQTSVETLNQEKKANLNEIEKIDFRRSRGYMALYKTGIIIFFLMFVCWSCREIIFNYRNWFNLLLEHIAVDSFFSMSFILIAIPILMLTGTPSKEVLIKFKDKDKICFPYYTIHDKEIKEFIEYVIYSNPEIKVVNKRKITDFKIIFISSILICLQLFFVYVGYESYRYNLEEKEMNKAIQENNYYSEEELIKLKYLKKDNFFDYNIYKNVNTGEKIKIKEDKIITRTNREYNAFVIKYYSKENKGKLLAKRYEIIASNNKDISFKKYGKQYCYYNSKLYKFNSEIDGTVTFFDRDINEEAKVNFLNKNSLYDFIYSDDEYINVEKNIFKSYRKLDSYNSVYGKCYIIKAEGISSRDTSYIMYIEINDSLYEGIIFDVDEKNLKRSDNYLNNVLQYFRNILPEK